MWFRKGSLAMNLQKIIILGLIILIVLGLILFFNNRRQSKSEVIWTDFVEMVEDGTIGNLNLTIYYLSPFVLTPAALSIEDLRRHSLGYHIIVEGNTLEEYVEVFKQLANIELIPVQEESRIHARMNYVFRNSRGNEIFSVAMGGRNNSLFVNGHEVEENQILYDIIKPFLPDDVIRELGW